MLYFTENKRRWSGKCINVKHDKKVTTNLGFHHSVYGIFCIKTRTGENAMQLFFSQNVPINL